MTAGWGGNGNQWSKHRGGNPQFSLLFAMQQRSVEDARFGERLETRALLLGSSLEIGSKEKTPTAIRWSRINPERTDGNMTTTGNGRPESEKKTRSGEHKTGRDEKCEQKRQFQLWKEVKSDPGHSRRLKWGRGSRP